MLKKSLITASVYGSNFLYIFLMFCFFVHSWNTWFLPLVCGEEANLVTASMIYVVLMQSSWFFYLKHNFVTLFREVCDKQGIRHIIDKDTILIIRNGLLVVGYGIMLGITHLIAWWVYSVDSL